MKNLTLLALALFPVILYAKRQGTEATAPQQSQTDAHETASPELSDFDFAVAPPTTAHPPAKMVSYSRSFVADDSMAYQFQRPEPIAAATALDANEFGSAQFGPGDTNDASLAERALLQAVRSVVYRKGRGIDSTHSTEGEMDPTLCANARLTAKALAYRQVQNHYGWDSQWDAPVNGKLQRFAARFHTLRGMGYSGATEIVSESWPEDHFENGVQQNGIILDLFGEAKPYSKLTYEQKLQVHAQSCVRGWMGSRGHKSVMDKKTRSGRYCYSMARGRNGIFYCAGIVD